MDGTTMNQAVLSTTAGPGSAARLPLTRGRRVALAIGVPLCLMLTAYTGFSLVANIGRGKVAVSYLIPVSAKGVSVSTSGGDVQVRQGASGSRASLVGTGSYSLVRPHITERLAAGKAAIAYNCPVPVGNCGLNATLSVPKGTTVSVSSDGGNVTAVGTTGQVILLTGGGDVTANRVTGALTMRTDGGNIQALAVAATQVTAHTGGGGIKIVFTQVPRDVRVSTDGGNITIIVPPGNAQYRVTASTGGGNVTDEVPRDTSSPNVITATSGGGNVTIRQGTSL